MFYKRIYLYAYTAFKLESRRNCNIVISSTGTVNISIQCTLNPWFSYSEGLNFFTLCGQIWKILQLETDDRLTVVPPIYEWYFERFDYNKDISVKYLEPKYSSSSRNKRWVVEKERTNSWWHNRFRNLFIWYEKKVENYLGLVQLSCSTIIIYRKIILGRL